MNEPLRWIKADEPLPDAHTARTNPPGLVAAGLDLSIERLNEAYRKGIFPWFSDGQPVLWWSPDPRMVLYTDELHLSHSLKKRLRQIERTQTPDSKPNITVTTDLAFDAVLKGCAQRGTDTAQDTWITDVMRQAYCQWHRAGAAHSIEVWSDQTLVGGLYGVCLGRMFFGESMFSRCPDTSKIAMVYLVRFLKAQGVTLIDCQMQTDHLARLGAREIARTVFLNHVTQAVTEQSIPWFPGHLTAFGQIEENHEFVIGQAHHDRPIGYDKLP
jgi:leucyl/phenylalanyl-tRNA--protein transferase